MDIYKTRQFDKWASKEGLTDEVLTGAILEMQAGLIDADLGWSCDKEENCIAKPW